MESLFAKILSENGLIYLLFFMIIGGFIWKGIPYLTKAFENIVEKFLITLEKMQINYKEELKEIRETFIGQIQASNNWHEKHTEELKEIKSILQNKKK